MSLDLKWTWVNPRSCYTQPAMNFFENRPEPSIDVAPILNCKNPDCINCTNGGHPSWCGKIGEDGKEKKSKNRRIFY